jgi:hypothetical protein
MSWRSLIHASSSSSAFASRILKSTARAVHAPFLLLWAPQERAKVLFSCYMPFYKASLTGADVEGIHDARGPSQAG